MQLDEDILSTILEEIFDKYKFDPHSHVFWTVTTKGWSSFQYS